MLKTIFVINAGSSSVKASLLCPYSSIAIEDGLVNPQNSEQEQPLRIATAHAERLHSNESRLHISISSTATELILRSLEQGGNNVAEEEILSRSDCLQLPSRGTEFQGDHTVRNEIRGRPSLRTIELSKPDMTHDWAIETTIQMLKRFSPELVASVAAVGHRVAHHGFMNNGLMNEPSSAEPGILNGEVLEHIQSFSHLAPLNIPANVQGMTVALEVFKDIPNVAVYDTAFHQTIPEEKRFYTCPISMEYPLQYHQEQNKCGSHGISVKYVSHNAGKILGAMGKPFNRMIIAHLGNSASATAVVNGQSIDTRKGVTLSSIMMGTTSGSVVNPMIPVNASREMNNRNGLFEVGRNSDMRVIIQEASEGDEDAQLAIDIYIDILAKHIASLIISCDGFVDALVFTAGIGENSPLIRRLIVDKLSTLLGGIQVDDAMNEVGGKPRNGLTSLMNEDTTSCAVLVVRTDEEAMICLECEDLILHQ